MERPARKFPILTMAIILVAMGLLIDGLVILKQTPEGLEFILFADIPIFMGLTLDFYLYSKTKARVLSVAENRNSASDTGPEITSEMFQSANVAKGPPRSESVSQTPLPRQKRVVRSESPKPKYSYSKSPERMNLPAFLCSCGHPHRFVCLACGMTVEKALNKKDSRWVEWLPEMGSQQ